MTSDEQTREIADALTKKLTDEGKLIEVGFVGFRYLVMQFDASDDQVAEAKLAFMAGAEHLFSSIDSIVNADKEPTEEDLRRIEKMRDELQAWREMLSARAKGNQS